MQTITLLRDAAKKNIMEYCKKHNCEHEYNLFERELIRLADESNTKLPIDFYATFYNKSLNLLTHGSLF